MSSFIARRDANGIVFEVEIVKDKTFWMKLFKKPCKITYSIRNGNWYNDTCDRIASFSEEEEIDYKLGKSEYIDRNNRQYMNKIKSWTKEEFEYDLKEKPFFYKRNPRDLQFIKDVREDRRMGRRK